MAEYNAMQRHWRANGPPVYMSVAGYLGLIKEDKKASTEYGSLDELEKMFGSTGGEISLQ